MEETENSEKIAKTPVTLLQEICAKKGLQVEYVLVSSCGPDHRPEFTYNIKAGHLTAAASGASKKQAKHNVAMNLLTMLTPQSVSPATSSSSVHINDEESCLNPIGKLQELSQKNLWSPPIYEFSLEKGHPHEKLFVCSVSLMNYFIQGSGTSKRLAKRNAAEKLLKTIGDSTSDCENIENIINDTNIPLPIIEDVYEQLKSGSSIPSLSPDNGQKIARFFQDLKFKTGKTLASLQSLSLNVVATNYCQLLQEVAEEQKFEVSYMDYNEKSLTGEFQSCVQLSKDQIAVCHGMGLTLEDAHFAAAHNALQYLKIMTRKT